ncbi:MAG: TonB-dependent receptor, partial [Proteobacteria bacterium]|nr:TonB-dependent receptor [Pseudomonadota bacterium]
MNRSAIKLTASLTALAFAQFATGAHAADAIAQDLVKTSGATADTTDDGAAAGGDASNQTGSFSEIIVSATKRETDLQKTPIAISVVDPQMMEDRHIQSLLDLGDGAAPSLRVATFEARQSALTVGIRGIVPFDANQTARDQGVGVYIDGVYLGRQQGLNAALFDVQRIEVLRGPQGTLFGRNTEGGAVSIVTKDPTGEFGGRLVGGVGNYGAYNAEAHVNLPEFANISIKIDGLIQHQDATTKNPME